LKNILFRLLILWHRLLGKSDVQAEWRARQALSKPQEIKSEVQGHAIRAADFRYKCVCGQLLTKSDSVCHGCGRRQYTPHWIRSFFRFFKGFLPSTAPATILIGMMILLGYIVQMRYGGGGFFNPLPNGRFYDLGASLPSLTLGSQPWRAFTYTLLHGGFWHLLFNGLVLVQIGPMVESAFGSARFVFAWVLTGALATIIPGLLGFERPVIGASGAIFGLMGMAMVFGHRLKTPYGQHLRNTMITWTVYSTLFGFMMGGVAHDAHFAGMAAGILTAVLLPPPERISARHRMSPVLVFLALGWIIYSLMGAMSWVNADRPVPESAPISLKSWLVNQKAKNEGLDSVLDKRGQALVDQACRLRREGMDESGLTKLHMEVVPYLKQLKPSHQYLFRRMMASCLYPDGRRPSNGRREGN